MIKIKPSEITPEHIYINRREFLKAAGIISASAVLSACSQEPKTTQVENQAVQPTTNPQYDNAVDERGDKVNAFDEITNFNNFYEFTTTKEAVASMAKDFVTKPWTITVDGLVNNPKTYGIEDILEIFPQEDRIYRLRCVEGWSMVIPWLGFPLAELLKEVEPKTQATHVRFEALLDPDQMPGQKSRWYTWPYVEGLRIDEAMNNLAILSTGLYGKELPNQSGAPIRLVVPWKYGFKSIKSIVRIELVDYQPNTLWMNAAPKEYGFFSNVNPEVDHPRWSQATERRIGEFGRRDTLLYNGYAEEVAHLYTGMDLSAPNS